MKLDAYLEDLCRRIDAAYVRFARFDELASANPYTTSPKTLDRRSNQAARAQAEWQALKRQHAQLLAQID